MVAKFLAAAVAVAAIVACPAVHAAVDYKIVTASERGTYIQIGKDLAKFVAPEADIALEVLASSGSADNVNRLRYDTGVKFAIVQSDVYQAFLDHAGKGNAAAERLIRPMRVIVPLYDEEIYFVVRADSPLQYVHEIRNQRINVGPLKSGTAMSATTIYRLMYNEPLQEANTTFMPNEEALVKLAADKTVDVVAIVAGQPAKILADIKPEAKQVIRLLKVDPSHAATRAALRTYVPATIRSASYPNWLDQDVQGFAVRAFLVTYDFRYPRTTEHMVKFARSLCQNFTQLQAGGHPKWRDVKLTLPPLGRGWAYYTPSERVLRNCRAAVPAAAAPGPVAPAAAGKCGQTERVLGLCNGL